MRIVVINGATDLYGANRILSLALESFPKNYRVQLLLPALEGPLVNHIRINNPEIEISLCEELPIIQRSMLSVSGGMHLLKLLKNFYYFLKRENREEKIDWIYVNTLSNFFVLPVARNLNIKTLTHVHEILENPKWLSKFINKYGVKWSTSILAVSQAVKFNLLKCAGQANNPKITVIHNGIPDLLEPKPNVNDPSQCIITLIARIKPEKGIWYFLDALSLLKNHPGIVVRIIGGAAPNGEIYVDQLKRDILEVDADISYYPFTLDVKKYLNETDILVVPSIGKESFPTTVLEGMSVGKSVVATDNGGAAEAIVQGESGFLIKHDDPHGFALILEQLIIDEELRRKTGLDARKRYLSHFSKEIYLSNMERFLIGELEKNQ